MAEISRKDLFKKLNDFSYKSLDKAIDESIDKSIDKSIDTGGQVLMAKDKGAEKGAKHFGMRSATSATKFVCAMQKHHPDFDMCSLACWLCLANLKKKNRKTNERNKNKTSSSGGRDRKVRRTIRK